MPFGPGWYYQPGLKVLYEPGLKLAGALAIRTGTNGPISPGSNNGRDKMAERKALFLLVVLVIICKIEKNILDPAGLFQNSC